MGDAGPERPDGAGGGGRATIGTFRGAAAVTIGAGDLEATYLPQVGMLAASLRHRGEELLALPGGLAAYRAGHVMGLPLLAPWANRLGSNRYRVAGVQVDVAGLCLHTDDNGVPIHGTMTAQPGWQIVRIEAGEDTAVLGARFDYGARPDLLAAFPFPHRIELRAEIHPGSLSVATTITPTAERAVPVAFGWHPYFHLPGAPRRSWLLGLPARRHMALDDRGLPTGESEQEDAENGSIGSRTFDDLYDLWPERPSRAGSTGPERPSRAGSTGPERPSRAGSTGPERPELSLEGGGRRVTVSDEEGYPYAQVFAPPGQAFACLEPMTAPTNSLVTGGYRLVEPDTSSTARFAVRVETTTG